LGASHSSLMIPSELPCLTWANLLSMVKGINNRITKYLFVLLIFFQCEHSVQCEEKNNREEEKNSQRVSRLILPVSVW
jgi:hypothetical protein